MKQITLPDFLTDEQIEKARELYMAGTPGFARAVKDLLIEPNIEEINRKLGQENDPMFLAYAVEYVFNET